MRHRAAGDAVAQWERVVEDLSAWKPTLGVLLLGTGARTGDPGETPFRLTIVFPPKKLEDWEKIRRRADLAQDAVNYFREIFERPVEVSFEKGGDDKTAEMMSLDERRRSFSPDGDYELDLENMPLLRRLKELFQTTHISTQPLKAEPEAGGTDEHPEDDERHAEDAE